MTPAERKAKLEAAKRLLQEAEADDNPNMKPSKPSIIQKIVDTPKMAPVPAAPTPAAVAKPVTGPGGDTRQSGVPSVAETLKAVWKYMRGVK